MSTQANFDLREDLHTFDVYFEHVMPLPQNLWIGNSDGFDGQLGLSSSALLSGQGRLLFEDNGAPKANMATFGDLFGIPIRNFMQRFVPCVATTCAVEARFNLVGYRYVNSPGVATLELNPHGGQGIVYLQRQNFAGSPSDFPRAQIYSTVPAPGSLMLCAGAVCALMLRVRRRFVPTTSTGAAISAQAARLTPLRPSA